MSRNVALVQARMGSTRLPGKMLSRLGELPVLAWVLRRASAAQFVDRVVLATSDLPRDDALIDVAKECGVEVFRGSESDVLGRFADAAGAHANAADNVIRICADNPFIDPGELDRLVDFFRTHPCDYACNHQSRLGSGYADGFGAEILSAAKLFEVGRLAQETRHREHVTLYLWDHSDRYDLRAVSPPPSLAYPELRFDVDEPADLQYLQSLCALGADIAMPAERIVRLALSLNAPKRA